MTTSSNLVARLVSASAAIIVTIAALATTIVPGSPQATLLIGGLA